MVPKATAAENRNAAQTRERHDIETMHGLFRWCAQQWPSGVAIISGERRVTYRELQTLADDYAVELLSKGVGRGDVVPVLMARTPEFIAAVLAVLECGAAYAAFDVRWPAERLAALVTALDAKLLVTAVAGEWPVPVAAPPSSDSVGGREPSRIEVRGDEACTVYFTSGSTGTPKAVVAPHSGVVRLFAECDFAELGPGIAVPQLAPVSWDGFTLDCVSVLLNGGTSVFLDDPVLVPSTLRRIKAEHGVNAVFLTTTLFNMIVDEDLEALDELRWVLTGGERASTDHMRRFVQRFPAIELHNMYGPVESTVVVTERRVTVEDCAESAGVPLGRVLNGTKIFVLEGDKLCDQGETGELCIAGTGLVSGYLGDPELTAKVFTEIVADGETHRVYRTGDRGHFSAEGVLYFDGRNDRQIKIRGHRIEPAEIEWAAEHIAGVTTAAVVPVSGPDGRNHALFLCYAGSGENVPDEPVVRGELAARLPGYLVPGRIRRLAAMPLLANGKVDQRTLKQLAAEADQAENPEVPDLLDRVETRVAELFGQILGRRVVTAAASFFELGASSLDVARLCAKLDAELGVAVPVAQVFATPTVRDLAAAVRPMLDRSADTVEALPEPDTGRIDLPVHYALALWEGISEGSDLAFLCTVVWWIDGTLDMPALSRALLDVHLRHQALHCRYVMDPGPTAIPCPDAAGPALRVLAEVPTEHDAKTALHAELYRPLSLADGKIWRCAVVRSADSGRVLFGISVHHMGFDGASQAPMAADLSTAYQARLLGRAPVFAEPAQTLAELADIYARQRAVADVDAQLSYWNRELADLPPITLPQRQSAEVGDGPRVSAVRGVSGGDMEPWDAAARELGSTRLAALALAYYAVLRKLSGQHEFGLLVPFSRWIGDPGRSISTRMDMLVMHLRPPATEAELWDNVSKTVGAALAATDVSCAEAAMPLLAELGEEFMGRLPVLQVENLSDPALLLPSCRTEFVRLDAPTTMSELETEVWYSEDGGIRLSVSVWTDHYPIEVANEIADEFQRVLRVGPGEWITPADSR